MSLAAGTRLDSYEIVAPLGAGGMGEVYRACDRKLKRDVAIKVLPDFWSRDPERLHRFELEAQAAAALNHPNIVSIFHVGQYNGSSYIVTELLQGESLREHLRHGPMRVREAIDAGMEIAQGLAAAHAASTAISSRKISSSRKMAVPRFSTSDSQNWTPQRFRVRTARLPATNCKQILGMYWSRQYGACAGNSRKSLR